jgi:hypothetical protein
MPFLEEINERRAEDRRKADRRKSESATLVEVSSFHEPPFTEPVRKPVVSQSFGPRISSQVSNRQIDKQMNDFLDRLLEKAGPEPKPEPKPLSDAEVLAMLATEATLMFASSKPCWLTDAKAKGAGAGE